MTENYFAEDEPLLMRNAQAQWLSVKTNILITYTEPVYSDKQIPPPPPANWQGCRPGFCLKGGLEVTVAQQGGSQGCKRQPFTTWLPLVHLDLNDWSWVQRRICSWPHRHHLQNRKVWIQFTPIQCPLSRAALNPWSRARPAVKEKSKWSQYC